MADEVRCTLKPGTIAYDACHARDRERIAQLKRELDEARARLETLIQQNQQTKQSNMENYAKWQRAERERKG